MKSIIAGILRHQAEILRRGLGYNMRNFYLVEMVLPNGLPGSISYAMVIEELENMADELENEE